MGHATQTRAQLLAADREAQSFDRVAETYDRLGDLSGGDSYVVRWLETLLPAAAGDGGPLASGRALDLGCGSGRHAVLLATRFGHVDAIDLSGPMIEVARARRSRPNVTYRQADLQQIGLDSPGQYDFVLSVLTLHHVPDLHAALSHIKSLVAPGGRLAVLDMYPPQAYSHPRRWTRRWLEELVPLRLRLHAGAILQFGWNLPRHGPAASWVTYRLRTRSEWLDHRVTDQFFSYEDLVRTCQTLFPPADHPTYRLDPLGGRAVALVWYAPFHDHEDDHRAAV
jgi:ubiquinone/menaquinone biosynthesis C-methylase UbiE